MHVLQYIAVQSVAHDPEDPNDGKEEAFRSVSNTFESMYSESEGLGGWSDWFVVGGGRWNSNPDNQYSEKNAWNDVIAYGENPELFTEKIDRAIISRKVEFNGYRQRFEEKGINLSDSLDSYDGNMDYSFELYDLSKCIDMLQGRWDFNSYFYDVTNWSTNPKHMLDKVDNTWYLVPVDFHF